MSSDAQLARWKAEAEKLREDSKNRRFNPVRDELLEIAQRYDRLLVRAARQFAASEAREAERAQPSPGTSSETHAAE